jgi:hypothetical protein
VKSRATVAAVAVLFASIIAGGARGEESPVATVTISGSLSDSYLEERLIEGVMRFRGSKYLLTLHGISGSASSVGSVFGLRRPRDIVGPYTSTADGMRNESGVTIRFEPPLETRGRTLRIELSSRVYPKASTGQGGDVE